MAEPRREAEPPLSAGELGAIAREIAAEANKARVRIHFVERLGAVADLLGEEEVILARVGALRQAADELAVTVAAADSAERRLAGLEDELAERESSLLKQAGQRAEAIEREAWAKAETIALDAKRKAAAATQIADEEARRRQADIADLDKTITDRERRLASIETQIARLRAKINE
jgi:hypothetical protein